MRSGNSFYRVRRGLIDELRQNRHRRSISSTQKTILPEGDAHFFIINSLRAFYWFDEGFQNILRAKGLPIVSRTQSMIILNVIMGRKRVSDIARFIGVSRQAAHQAVGELLDLELIEMINDTNDGRSKVLKLRRGKYDMQRNAQYAVEVITQELGNRIGKQKLKDMQEALAMDWGPALTFEGESDD